MSKKRRIPIRKRKFLALYLGAGPTAGNAMKCALAIYNCKDEDSARSLGSQVLSSLNIPLREIMRAKGIDDDALMGKLQGNIEAKETKFATFEGKFSDEREVINLTERRKSLELAHRLRGDLTNTLKLELPPEVSINIQNKYVPAESESAG